MNCGMLRLFDGFTQEKDGRIPSFSYSHTHEGLLRLRDTYRLDDIAGTGDQTSRIMNLLDWLHQYTDHNGQITKRLEMNSLSLLSYSFKKGKEFGINCRMLATVLAEICLSLGFKSRIASLHSITPFDTDNHVVTMVWLSSRRKWISVDPTFNAYFTDDSGGILNPWEIRSAFADQREVRCNYAGAEGDNQEAAQENLMQYMSKNLFFMHSPQLNHFGSEDLPEQRWITLVPANYDIRSREMYHWEWRKKRAIECNMWHGELRDFVSERRARIDKGYHVYTSSLTTFFDRPSD